MESAGNGPCEQRSITMRVSADTYQFPLPLAGEGEGEGKTCAAPPSPKILSLLRRARRLSELVVPRSISSKKIFAIGLIVSLISSTVASLSKSAETLEQSIAAAKKESELYFVAGPTTFGGKKGLADLEAAFNKKFGLNLRMRFSAGPEMNAMAGRVITELKARGKQSTGIV